MFRQTSLLLISCLLLTAAAGCASSQPSDSNDLPASAREVQVQKKLEDRPSIARVEDLLIGEPGVHVQGTRVRIRGSRSAPLWVIDGVYADSPTGINPRDIERMWIVPDGSGYGRRGANGVVILTTKI